MNSIDVIQVGPDPGETGGMSAVMRQLMSLTVAGYSFHLFADTSRVNATESRFAKAVRHLRHAINLRRSVRRHHAELVHIHTCSGFSFFRSALSMLAARSAGARVILHVHGARFDAYHAGSSWWKRRLIRRIFSSADAVVALSGGWREKLSTMAPAARVVAVENAVAMPSEVPVRSADGVCRVLMLARMDVWKGVDDLLDAAALLGDSPFHLTLAGPAGTAGDPETLQRKIEARGLTGRVAYVGSVHGLDKEMLLATCDVLVSPSHHEGMPISILEAMGHGLAVVATRVGAVEEMISHGETGLLVPAGNVEEFADSLRRVIEDAALRGRLGMAARRTAERRFSSDVLARRLRVIYDGILEPSASPGRELDQHVEPA